MFYGKPSIEHLIYECMIKFVQEKIILVINCKFFAKDMD